MDEVRSHTDLEALAAHCPTSAAILGAALHCGVANWRVSARVAGPGSVDVTVIGAIVDDLRSLDQFARAWAPVGVSLHWTATCSADAAPPQPATPRRGFEFL